MPKFVVHRMEAHISHVLVEAKDKEEALHKVSRKRDGEELYTSYHHDILPDDCSDWFVQQVRCDT